MSYLGFPSKAAGTPREPEYRSWGQVSGYFDGDGNVRLEVRKFGLRLGVRFADTWRPQLEAIRNFMIREGYPPIAIGKDENRLGKRRAAYRLDISETSTVMRLMKAMVEHCVKKKEDLRIAIDYLEDKITGDEAVSRFNEQVRIGRRRGFIHTSALPYKKSEGHRLYELASAKRAREFHLVQVPQDTKEKIISDYRAKGMGVIRLARKYGFSTSVIRRVLGRR